MMEVSYLKVMMLVLTILALSAYPFSSYAERPHVTEDLEAGHTDFILEKHIGKLKLYFSLNFFS